MAEAVGHKSNLLFIFAGIFWAFHIQNSTDFFDEVDILLFGIATKIIRLARFSLGECEPDAIRVVFYMNPIAHIRALAINR